MNKHLVNRCLVAGMILLLGNCLGCGTKDYEARLQRRGRELAEGSVFNEMHPARKLPNTSVSIRVPPKFKAMPLPEDTDTQQLKPPLPEDSVLVKGLKLTYEGAITDSEGGQMSFYCHLITIDSSYFGTRRPVDSLSRVVKRDFSESADRPTNVQCQTPEGLEQTWHKVHATGVQKFRYVNSQGQSEFRDTEGVMDLYVRKEGEVTIVILWRVPTYLTGKDFVGIDEWGPVMAGSVKVE